MNKKTAVQLAVAITLIIAAGIWGRGDQLEVVESVPQPAAVEIPEGTPAAVTKPLPESQAKIVQSVADLSAQIVDNAYNNERTEALVATAAAVSLRVNTLKAEAMAQAEKAAVSGYNKALADAKSKLAGEEARAGLPKDESKGAAAPVFQQPYTMPFQQRDESKPATPAKPDDFEAAQLKAIIATDELASYKAILHVSGRERSVRAGQTIAGNIRVNSITRNNVVISAGDRTKTLYLP